MTPSPPGKTILHLMKRGVPEVVLGADIDSLLHILFHLSIGELGKIQEAQKKRGQLRKVKTTITIAAVTTVQSLLYVQSSVTYIPDM